MPTANFGPYAVIPSDGLYAVVERGNEKPVTFADGNPAIFVVAKDAFLWILHRLMRRDAQ